MKVAMFIKDEKLDRIKADTVRALVFDIDGNKIVGIEEDCLYKKNLDFLSVWLLNKQINIVYIQDTNNSIDSYFQKLDIEVKTHEDLKNDPLFYAFLL
jgi:hypothetical protein